MKAALHVIQKTDKITRLEDGQNCYYLKRFDLVSTQTMKTVMVWVHNYICLPAYTQSVDKGRQLVPK